MSHSDCTEDPPPAAFSAHAPSLRPNLKAPRPTRKSIRLRERSRCSVSSMSRATVPSTFLSSCSCRTRFGRQTPQDLGWVLKVQASHQASLDLPPRAEAPRPQAFSTLSLKTPTASAFTCVLSGHVCFKWPAPVSLEISYHPPASAASAPRAHDLKKGQAALGGGSPWQRHRSYITDTNRCAWPENHRFHTGMARSIMKFRVFQS